MKLVPSLPTHQHSFGWMGVALSGVGMFCLVFGIQEGHQYDWGTITGVITVWRLIILGLVVLAIFVFWQSRNRQEPLVPLRLFRDRNFRPQGRREVNESVSACRSGWSTYDTKKIRVK